MDEPLVETEVADSEPPRRSGPWKLIVIVAVITLIGVWLVPDDKPSDEVSVTAPPGERPGTAATKTPSLLSDGPTAGPSENTAAGEPGAAVEVTDNRPGAKARALIGQMRAQGKVDLEAAIAAARKSQIAGELADAYLLYFFAAREGSLDAALELGKQADPATRDPLSSVFENPDFNQAHKWYQKAASGGNTEARNRLQDLHQRVEKLAASGDAQAKRISLLWQ